MQASCKTSPDLSDLFRKKETFMFTILLTSKSNSNKNAQFQKIWVQQMTHQILTHVKKINSIGKFRMRQILGKVRLSILWYIHIYSTSNVSEQSNANWTRDARNPLASTQLNMFKIRISLRIYFSADI